MQRVFLSDLHIGDGFLDDNFSFDDELTTLLESFSSTDIQTELVLLGDGFELLASKAVRDMGLCPFEEVCENIPPFVIDQILTQHPKVFSALKKFLKRHQLTYVVGNHDYYFLTKKALQIRVNELLAEGEGIHFVPYFYDPLWGVFAFHGSNFDVVNRFGKEKKTGVMIPPIGDYMARYMMIHFRERARNEDIPFSIVEDFDDVRPNIDFFEWIKYIKETYHLGIDLAEIWMTECIKMLRTATAKSWMKRNYPKVHKLSGLFVNDWGGVQLGRFLIEVASKLRQLRRTDYMRKKAKQILLHGAENESDRFVESDFWGFCDLPAIDYQTLNGVLFGHRHKFDHVFYPYKGQNKFYINTGTWRKVIERGNRKDMEKFVRRSEFSYVILREQAGDLSVQTLNNSKIRNPNLALPNVEVG